MHVWLRRQEIEALRSKLLVQGVQEIVLSKQDTDFASVMHDVYNKLLSAMFPFLDTSKRSMDAELRTVMEREIARGNVYFSPISTKMKGRRK